MKLHFLIALLLTGVFRLHGQDYEKRPWMPLESRIGIMIGIGRVSYLDENTSPLQYRSKPKNVRLFYTLESNKFLFSVDFDIKMGGLFPKDHPHRTLFFREENYKGEKEDK